MLSNTLRIFLLNFASFLMVLGPEQVTWTTIFHNYLRSSVTNFRGSQTENMSRRSSVVQVIGDAGHRGHRWCRSPGVIGGASHRVVYVTEVIGGVSHRGSSGVYVTGVIGGTGHRRHRWCIIAVTTFIYLQYFISNVFFTFFFIIYS